MNAKNGTLFVVAAPSGAGKTSLLKELSKKNNRVIISISHTTRKPRDGEIEGEDYFFVDEKSFKKLIEENHFLEHARVFGNHYGTSHSFVESQIQTGKKIILEIDWQGMQKIKAKGVEIIGIFILPPDYITLEERLINRQKDSSKTIKQRMNAALDEISHYKEFDFIVVNDKFDETVAKLNEIISDPKTDHNRRNSSHDKFISKIMAQRD
mgnify:FL=1